MRNRPDAAERSAEHDVRNAAYLVLAAQAYQDAGVAGFVETLATK